MRLIPTLIAGWLAAAAPCQAQMTTTGAGGSKASAAATAPFALDGTPQSANSGGTSALALPAFSTTYANDIVFAAFVTNGGPGLAPSCTCGLTFTRRTQTNDGSSTDNNELWYAIAPSPLAGAVITINTTTSAFVTGSVFAFSGVKTSAPFDLNAAIPNTNNLGFVSGSWTTSNANDILLFVGRTGGAVTAASGFTLINGTNYLGVQYQSVSTTQSGLAASWGSGTGGGGNAADAIVMGP